jgi:hypothetical protein
LGTINFNAINSCADQFLGSLASLRSKEHINRTEVVANSLSIEQSVRSLTNSPWASDHPQNIAKIWPKHDLLLKSMQLSTVELYTYRLIYMTGISAPYTWVETIVWKAINTEPSVNLTSAPADYESTWVHQLVKDLNDLYLSGLHKSKMVAFSSTKYLPHLEQPVTHNHKIGRVLYDPDAQQEQLAAAATDIIRAWLHFPITPKVISQWMFVATIKKVIDRHSIFLLEPVWNVFQSPLLTLEGRNQGSNNRTEKHPIWRQFEASLQQHPLASPQSWLTEKLEYLHGIVMMWIQESQIDRKTIEKAQLVFTEARSELRAAYSSGAKKLSKTKGVIVDLSSLPPSKDDRRMLFVNFLRCGLPLLKNGVAAYVNSSDKFLKKIANSPDKFMPYREHAPTCIRSRDSIYDDPAWLRTSVGFWNVLCFRGVFYGSEFACEDGRYFDDLDDWKAFSKDKAPSYFVVKTAYGSLQGDRSIDRVEEYWEKRHLWEPLIKKKDLSLFDVYDFLLHSSVDGGRLTSSRKKGSQAPKGNDKSTAKKVFINIGSLTAILIIGDLVYAGILPMPSPLDWGKFIEKVSKGALAAMTMLGLIDEDTTVPQAFADLDDFVNRALTPEEKSAITYNVLTGEHSLCKYKRLYGRGKK